MSKNKFQSSINQNQTNLFIVYLYHNDTNYMFYLVIHFQVLVIKRNILMS